MNTNMNNEDDRGLFRFGEVIRQAVEARGWSQREFAARLGVSQPRVNEIFSSGNMTERLLDRCVNALGARLEVRLVDADAEPDDMA